MVRKLLQNTISQQGRDPPPYILAVRDVLEAELSNLWIDWGGSVIWPARPLDFTRVSFSCEDMLKKKCTEPAVLI